LLILHSYHACIVPAFQEKTRVGSHVSSQKSVGEGFGDALRPPPKLHFSPFVEMTLLMIYIFEEISYNNNDIFIAASKEDRHDEGSENEDKG
jgi:hypothetical protein